MNIRVLIIGLSVAASSIGVTAQGTAPKATPSKPAPSGAAADKATIEKALVANENKVNQAVAKGDAAGFSAVVAADGWSLEPTGPSSVDEFIKNISQVKMEPGWKITDTKVLWVDPNTAILTYKWTGKGTYMGQPFPSPTWSSTTYTNRGGKWVAVFHQETTASPPPK